MFPYNIQPRDSGTFVFFVSFFNAFQIVSCLKSNSVSGANQRLLNVSALPTRHLKHKFRHGKLKTTVWCRIRFVFVRHFTILSCPQIPPTTDQMRRGRKGRGRHLRPHKLNLWRLNLSETNIYQSLKGVSYPRLSN